MFGIRSWMVDVPGFMERVRVHGKLRTTCVILEMRHPHSYSLPVAKFRLFIFAVMIIALAVLLEKQYEAHRQLRSQSDSLQAQFKRIEELEADNVRLSNTVARANTPLAEIQLAELRSLREQLEFLRHRTNEIASLRAEISQLRSALSDAGNPVADTPPDVPAEDVYPRENWAFAGYDTPENAIESLMWAVSEGDTDSYMAGLAPDLFDQMQGELADGSFAEDGPFEMGNISGYRIIDRDMSSDDEVTVTLYMDGENQIMPVVLKEGDDGRWTIAATGSP